MRLILAPVVFLLDLWAIISVLGSRASGLAKLLWVLGIIVFPIMGFLAWLFFGPKKE